MLVKEFCPWCIHAQKISEYCYGCYQKECNYKGIMVAFSPCDNIHKNLKEEHSELGTDIIKALQEATDEKKEKTMKIMKAKLAVGDTAEVFEQHLQETIDSFQNEGFEVSVQFKVDEYNYCALVIGRKYAEC